MPLILENVSFTYMPNTPYEARALKNVSLTVKDGEFVGVMGHTGSGKTTLTQLIAGLEAPASGRVLLDGLDINAAQYDRALLRKTVGLVFQYPEYQLFETTVEKDVAFALKYSGLSQAEVQARVREALTACGFDYEAVRRRSPLTLSGGEKRKAAIAGVLAARPKLLIFDEPIAGLDPLGRQSFLELIKGLNAQGATVLMVSHNIDALCSCARRIVALENGEVVLDGTPHEALRDMARMDALHLGVSAPRRVVSMLEERGVSIRQNVVSYDELLDALMESLTGSGV